MNYRLICMSLLALALAGCGRETPIGDVPETFYYKGAPIDPACFLDSSAQMGDAISLSICTGKNKMQPEYKEDHFYGTEITDMSGSVSSAYVYYRYLGESGDNHIIQTLSSSGGASQFSSLRLMQLDGNLLRTVKRFAGGDRCSGGIERASVVGNTIKYTKNITPYDLAILSEGNEAKFRRNTDLAATSDLCLGTATFEGEELQNIKLTLQPSEIPAETLKAECFLSAYRAVFKPERVLDEREILNFGFDLNKQCGELGK
jgi:hypothetical protein